MTVVDLVTSAGDGFVVSTSGLSFAAARNASSGTASDGTSTGTQMVTCGINGSVQFEVGRGFYPFDTSSLPDAAVISSALLMVDVSSFGFDSSGGGSVVVVSSTQASMSTLATSDFSLVGSTDYSDRVTFASMPHNFTYQVWTLNATGIAAINKSGNTKLALRATYDVDNSYPGSGYSVCYGFWNEQGVSGWPLLRVTYTLPGGSVSQPAGSRAVRGMYVR